ncbi:MAG: hypothetical protein GXZ08_03870 [Tissierellia bacterium]|nr:hypothetical protein [Tissierellia bacterium]
MGKYIGSWVVITGVIGIILFSILSTITRTTFVNLSSEYELLLMLIGFSSVISTIIVCTKIISDKIK